MSCQTIKLYLMHQMNKYKNISLSINMQFKLHMISYYHYYKPTIIINVCKRYTPNLGKMFFTTLFLRNVLILM